MMVPSPLHLRPSQHRMQAVANVSIGAMFCMYALTATFGYLTFYGEWGWVQGWVGFGQRGGASEVLPSMPID